jgi:hypothetical protein
MKGRPIKSGDGPPGVPAEDADLASMKGRPIKSGDVLQYMSVDWPQIHFAPR